MCFEKEMQVNPPKLQKIHLLLRMDTPEKH